LKLRPDGRLRDRMLTESRRSPILDRETADVMATAFAKEARRVHERGHLSDQLIARATGAARSTVRGWLALRSEPTGQRAERVAELSALVERLARIMEPDYIPVWLTKPVEALDNEKPIELIARGDYVRVARLVSSLEEPGAA